MFILQCCLTDGVVDDEAAVVEPDEVLSNRLCSNSSELMVTRDPERKLSAWGVPSIYGNHHPDFACKNPTAKCCLIGSNLPTERGGSDGISAVYSEDSTTSSSWNFLWISPLSFEKSPIWISWNFYMNFFDLLLRCLEKKQKSSYTKRWWKMAMNLMVESVRHHQINKHKLIMAYSIIWNTPI